MDEENQEENIGQLTPDIIQTSLSSVKRTIDGSGFAFTSLDISNKELEDIGSTIKK